MEVSSAPTCLSANASRCVRSHKESLTGPPPFLVVAIFCAPGSKELIDLLSGKLIHCVLTWVEPMDMLKIFLFSHLLGAPDFLKANLTQPPHVTDHELEPQRGDVISPRPHSSRETSPLLSSGPAPPTRPS